MKEFLSQENLSRLASRWLPPHRVPRGFAIYTDTTDYFRIGYDDVVLLCGKPYLIRHNAKELRFGLDDEVKFWVKRAIDLMNGSLKIIKLVFDEEFISHIGSRKFKFFRNPRKEARILNLVNGHKNFMHGYSIKDEKGNLVRVLDYIKGNPLSKYVENLHLDHETYFHEHLPGILDHFVACIQAIQFLHDHGQKHGDVRRDHIIMDQESGHYRWIDFDFDYRYKKIRHLYDLFGLGNVLVFLVGQGDVLFTDLKREDHPALQTITEDDVNIMFNNRIVNLKKIYPYIPEPLNRVLMHFSKGATLAYENTAQLLSDLAEWRNGF